MSSLFLIRWGFVVKRLFALFVAFLAFQPAFALAGGNASQTAMMSYAVYAGGIHAVDAQLKLKVGKTGYDTTLSAGTQGFLKSLANWSGAFSTKGKVTHGEAFPLAHVSISTWKDKTETKTFKYDGSGRFVSYRVDEDKKDTTPKDIDKKLAAKTKDVLSATLDMMMALPSRKACDGDALVFDGDRTYRLVFADTKIETLEASDYNVFQGETISCSVEVKPEKGKWRKKPRGWLSIQEQGRQKGALPKIWFGKLAGFPNTYVPVKIRVKTDYGTLFMHLTSAKVR